MPCFIPCNIGGYSMTLSNFSVAEKCFLIDLRKYGQSTFHVDGRKLEWLHLVADAVCLQIPTISKFVINPGRIGCGY
jgi:hypothetical protein